MKRDEGVLTAEESRYNKLRCRRVCVKGKETAMPNGDESQSSSTARRRSSRNDAGSRRKSDSSDTNGVKALPGDAEEGPSYEA